MVVFGFGGVNLERQRPKTVVYLATGICKGLAVLAHIVSPYPALHQSLYPALRKFMFSPFHRTAEILLSKSIS